MSSAPQRVFASGNERVASHFPDGCRLHVADDERGNPNYGLTNHFTRGHGSHGLRHLHPRA